MASKMQTEGVDVGSTTAPCDGPERLHDQVFNPGTMKRRMRVTAIAAAALVAALGLSACGEQGSEGARMPKAEATATDSSVTAQSAKSDVGYPNAAAEAAAKAVKCHKNRAYTWNTHHTQYLNVEGGSRKGAKVITWQWSGGKGNEKWCLELGKEAGYYFHPWNRRDLCLDVPGAKYKNGQGLIVWNCKRARNQEFNVTRQSTDGGTRVFYTITPVAKPYFKIHSGRGNGDQVSLWRHFNQNAAWL